MNPLQRSVEAIVDELRRQEPEHGGTYFVDAADLQDVVIDGRFNLYCIARAVLTAIREPSEGMMRAGETCVGPVEPSGFRGIDGAYPIWIAMIDAALAEGE